MKCPSCEAEVDDLAKFCPECGVHLINGEAQLAQAEADAGFPVPGGNEPPKEKFHSAVSSRQEDDDEEVDNIWKGSYSHKAMVGWFILAGVVTVLALVGSLMFSFNFWYTLLALIVGWAILGARYAYRRMSVHYHLTNQRFVHEAGILWRQIDRIELIDIDDVTFRQGPVERLFKVGTIHISSSDTTDPEIDLPGIENVRHVADLIDDLRRKERRRRGLHIEAV